MPFYEHVVLARQDIPSSQVDAINEEVTKTVEELGGAVTKTEYWGVKSLTYKIKKNRKAHFSLLNIDGPPSVVAELERRARLHDDIIRYITVKVDELEEEPSAMLRSRDRDKRKPRR